nr:MAG TPA: hypothetical protein [Caudoviricetes sp.]
MFSVRVGGSPRCGQTLGELFICLRDKIYLNGVNV